MKVRWPVAFLGTLILALTLNVRFGRAQTADSLSGQKTEPGVVRKLIKKYYTFSGSFGAYGELYQTTAKYKRLPSSTARSTLNFTFGFWKFQVPVQIVLSTEEVSYRQSFNRFGLNPKIGIFTFHAGDFAGRISQYTVSGISIRGGGIEIAPSWMRFVVIYGQTQRAVNDPRAMTYAFKRMLLAAKLGFGKRNKTFFELNFVKAKDDSNSVNLPDDSTKIHPQENLVLGANGQIVLFKNHLRISGEGAASVYTLNLRSDKVDKDQINIPDWVDKYYTLRLTTRLDYAYRGQIRLNTRRFRGQAGYQWIGPGFTSLGLPYTMNDREKYNGNAFIQVWPRKVILRGMFSYSHDNLKNQKVKTLKHINYMTGLMVRPVQPLTLNLVYSRNRLENETNLDSLIYWENNIEKKRQLFDTYNDRVMVNGEYVFQWLKLAHTFTLAYTLQKSQKRQTDVQQNNFDSQMITAGYNIFFSQKLNMALNFTNMDNKLASGTLRSQTYGFSLGYNPMIRWRNNVSVNMQKTQDQTSVNYTLTSRFRITARSSLNLNLYKIDFYDPVNPDREYKEHRGALSYTYNF
ncbi:hypothetical protein DRI50_10580 [candidate division KSB1 bacterium]|nr:MAG: hypothetical protein DRI50_10580 [candidate division KSB1 bacterium]